MSTFKLHLYKRMTSTCKWCSMHSYLDADDFHPMGVMCDCEYERLHNLVMNWNNKFYVPVSLHLCYKRFYPMSLVVLGYGLYNDSQDVFYWEMN